MSAALQRELEAAALAVGSVDLARAKALGIANAGVAAMGMLSHPFGCANVIETEGGLYEPSASGQRRLIVPVIEAGELVDLVAISSSDPDHWTVRRGVASLLGLADGWHYRWADAVPVHRNPIEWLKAGGDGLCIVDWDSPELYRLTDLPGFVVSDAGLGERLKAALTRPQTIPPIFIESAGALGRAA